MNYIHPIYITKPTTDKKLKYTKYRNLLNNLLRAAKKSHITSRIESNKLNMKETWKALHNLLGINNLNYPTSLKIKVATKLLIQSTLLITSINSLLI